MKKSHNIPLILATLKRSYSLTKVLLVYAPPKKVVWPSRKVVQLSVKRLINIQIMMYHSLQAFIRWQAKFPAVVLCFKLHSVTFWCVETEDLWWKHVTDYEDAQHEYGGVFFPLGYLKLNIITRQEHMTLFSTVVPRKWLIKNPDQWIWKHSNINKASTSSSLSPHR